MEIASINGTLINKPSKEYQNQPINGSNIPDGTYIINVNNHTYVGDRAYVDNLIKIGKESMKCKHAIIAVEKDKTIILLSQPHKTPKQLGISMAEYVSKGFKVYTA